MIKDEQLISDCIKHNKTAQRELYNKYSPVMRAICMRYSGDMAEAKDIMQDGFIKVFLNIGTYVGKGSFEGWIKRIMINTAIKHFHKKKKNKEVYLNDNADNYQEISDEDSYNDENYEGSNYNVVRIADFSESELMQSLNILKDNYRLVFNLYVMEDFSHKEISEMLNIDEKTSRSRLFRARNMVQEHLFELSKEKLQARYKL